MDIATRVRANPRLTWLTAAVETEIAWPAQEMCVEYQRHEFFLRPAVDDCAPSISIAYSEPPTAQSDVEAIQRIRRFLSVLAWLKKAKIHETATYGTGGYPGRIGATSRRTHFTSDDFRLDYLPDVADDQAKLCLGFYREALNLNSDAYKFLSFYKVLNVVYSAGASQISWINDNVRLLTNNYEALERIQEIQKAKEDVGQYLYTSGRCAIAHAFAEPLVDPDDPADTQRLRADLPVMQALAELLIEQRFGILTMKTYRALHLYELEGFRTLFGEELVAKLKTGQAIVGEIPPLPRLSFRVRKFSPCPSFEAMRVHVAEIRSGCVWLIGLGGGGLLQFYVGLNFRDEGIAFDLKTGVALKDDGSPSAIRAALDDNRFFRELIQLGELEIWNADTGVLLGRTDPLIPVNISMDETLKNLDAERNKLELILQSRLATPTP